MTGHDASNCILKLDISLCRSLKYGKLSQGTLVKVSPSLVKRRKTHFHKLPCGASVILGNNGFVWVSPTQHEEQGHDSMVSL